MTLFRSELLYQTDAEGQATTVEMTPPGANFDLEIYNTNKSLVRSSAIWGDSTEYITYTSPASGDFYIRVSHLISSTFANTCHGNGGFYSMDVTVT